MSAFPNHVKVALVTAMLLMACMPSALDYTREDKCQRACREVHAESYIVHYKSETKSWCQCVFPDPPLRLICTTQPNGQKECHNE